MGVGVGVGVGVAGYPPHCRWLGLGLLERALGAVFRCRSYMAEVRVSARVRVGVCVLLGIVVHAFHHKHPVFDLPRALPRIPRLHEHAAGPVIPALY